mmetsp:Transcript_71419/g.180262  ORF Transcript_71419/g.180262 Transcript_71419/m.180262 type:complete len:203 (+) Transcript_71419:500-1108(+)
MASSFGASSGSSQPISAGDMISFGGGAGKSSSFLSRRKLSTIGCGPVATGWGASAREENWPAAGGAVAANRLLLPPPSPPGLLRRCRWLPGVVGIPSSGSGFCLSRRLGVIGGGVAATVGAAVPMLRPASSSPAGCSPRSPSASPCAGAAAGPLGAGVPGGVPAAATSASTVAAASRAASFSSAAATARKAEEGGRSSTCLS